MTEPRYSIVIPTYRRDESLAECLESICALDYASATSSFAGAAAPRSR
jgi:glycosyltransferase involved in cell wall biosynthesis